MFFKRKPRQAIVEDKIEDVLHDILTLDFSNEEIGYILKSLSSIGKKVLEERKSSLEKQLLETCNAINLL